MRDLPPQTQAVVLEQPAPAFLDLPQLDLDAARIQPERIEFGFEATAPPDDQRLHAAPVGIVRLLT